MQPNSRSINLEELWSVWGKYAEYRKGQISPSTYLRDYRKVTRRLEKMRAGAPELSTAIEIRDWLLSCYSSETTRRTIQQFSSAGKWAVESDLIPRNVFEGLQRHLKPKRPSEKAWASFTAAERDRIIQAFELHEPFYSTWVKFLFWTGCRPEEASALRCEHIAQDFSEMLIREALPSDMRQAQGTKNGKITRYPCNSRLQTLLKQQTKGGLQGESFVFPGREGGRFNYHNFQTRYWRPIVLELVKSGQVAFYLSQYHCRHTWITLSLEHLPVADVSYLARVSTNVLYQHYAGRSRNVSIPEF